MNQKQVKRMNRWTRLVWDSSTPEERNGFASYEAFQAKVKDDVKRVPDYTKFIKAQLVE